MINYKIPSCRAKRALQDTYFGLAIRWKIGAQIIAKVGVKFPIEFISGARSSVTVSGKSIRLLIAL